MDLASILLPPDELFCCQAKRDHPELPIEPIRFEPQKEVDAENDWERREAESVCVAPRPAEQHVEHVGEQELGQDEGNEIVDGAPVPAPVQQYRALRAGLEVVLLFQSNFNLELPTGRQAKNCLTIHTFFGRR